MAEAPTVGDGGASWRRRIQRRSNEKRERAIDPAEAARRKEAARDAELKHDEDRRREKKRQDRLNRKAKAQGGSRTAGPELAQSAAAPVRSGAGAPPTLSLTQRNKLSARLVRAELAGKAEEAARIRKILARSPSTAAAPSSATPAGQEPPPEQAAAPVRKLTPFDEHGRYIESIGGAIGGAAQQQPALTRDDLRSGRRAGKRRGEADRTAGTGDRKFFFKGESAADEAAGGSRSVSDLVREERLGGRDIDADAARNILRQGGKFKGLFGKGGPSAAHAGADEEEEEDFRAFQSARDRLTDKERVSRERRQAEARARRQDDRLERDPYHVGGARFREDLVIMAGPHTLLMLPPGPWLCPGHLQIVAREPAPSMREAGDEAYDEANKIKAALWSMWGGSGVFTEVARRVRGMHGAGRAIVDCVPLTPDQLNDAPIFFSKEFQEAEQWAQHRAIIKLEGRSLRQAIPPNFPYVHVSWAGGGLAHIIEDDAKFRPSWALDVVAGLMEADPLTFRSEGPRAASTERAAAQAARKQFRPHGERLFRELQVEAARAAAETPAAPPGQVMASKLTGAGGLKFPTKRAEEAAAAAAADRSERAGDGASWRRPRGDRDRPRESRGDQERPRGSRGDDGERRRDRRDDGESESRGHRGGGRGGRSDWRSRARSRRD